MKVRTRFAPSPTGYLHIGSLRTALYSFAYARHNQGSFILRIEDTDRNRFVPGSTEKIYEQLKIFGINWDEGPLVGGPFLPYVQSDRVNLGEYKKAAEKLVNEGHAFYCFCEPKSKEEIKEAHDEGQSDLRDNNCRNLTPEEVQEKISRGERPAVRLKVPEGETISFYDLVIKKEISWNSKFVDDAMLLKSDGFPTYQLGVVVDDSAMEISHVLRAMEWLPSTPIHLLLFKYLERPIPQIGHVTDILDPEGGKLSKRKGNVSTEDFLSSGYLPEAILNFIMLLGWAPKDNREIFSLAEFGEYFDENGLQKSNAIFYPAKLNWFNQHYIRALDNLELGKRIKPFSSRSLAEIEKWLPLVKDRLVTLKDFDTLTEFLWERPVVDGKLFESIKANKDEVINFAVQTLEKDWDGKILETKVRQYCEDNQVKVGDFFMILRVAITGRANTPPLWEVMEILGREETLKRLK